MNKFFFNKFKEIFGRFIDYFNRFVLQNIWALKNEFDNFLIDSSLRTKINTFWYRLHEAYGYDFMWGFRIGMYIAFIFWVGPYLNQPSHIGFTYSSEFVHYDIIMNTLRTWNAILTLFAAKIMWLVIILLNKLYTILIPVAIIYFSAAIMLFKNPIYSLLALISVFFNVIFVLLSLKIEFLAMIFLIIYIGAISILFLFVIMLFNLRNIKYNTTWMKSIGFYTGLLSFGLFVKFFFIVKYVIVNSLTNTLQFFDFTPHIITHWYVRMTLPQDIMIIGHLFYTHFFELFLTIGYILLIAMVGAIILAISTSEAYPSRPTNV